MKIGTHNFVATYATFQRNKEEIVKTPGALQSLLIPTHIWVDITMDFIIRLPRVGNKYLISKYAQLCALPHPFTHSLVAQVFLD